MEYRLADGLRHVRPYRHTFRTHAKTRWVGRTLVDIYTNDLHYSLERTRAQIADGSLYVIADANRAGAAITGPRLSAHCVGRHDVVCSTVHVHEPCVPGVAPAVVYEDDRLVVVDKPGGVPTHPTGQYRYNTATAIVEHRLGQKVFPVHRLDRATSGVLVLAKSAAAAARFRSEAVRQKRYVARVCGEFPGGPWHTVVAPIFTINAAGAYLGQQNAANLPLALVTRFRRLGYSRELDQSVVLCKPETGRMHQIRIHLRNLGFPIVNDEFYNGTSPASRLCAELELGVYARVKQRFGFVNELLGEADAAAARAAAAAQGTFNLAAMLTGLEGELARLQRVKRAELDARAAQRPLCEECGQRLAAPLPLALALWLHALRYTYHDGDERHVFETAAPLWSIL